MIVVVVVVERVRRNVPPAGGIKMKIGGSRRPLLPQTIRCSNPTGNQWVSSGFGCHG